MTQAAAEATARARSGRWRIGGRLALGVVALLALVFIGRAGGGYLPTFTEWVNAQGAWGPTAFVLGYAVATVALVPGSLLTLASGAVFGVVKGTAYVFAGAVLGATLAFLVARFAGRRLVERRITGDPRFRRINDAVARDGRRIVFLLRLSPLLPFSLLNYALGLTRVRLGDYVVASLGMLPGTLLYVYSGRVAGDLATPAGGAPVERGAGYYAVLGVGLLATAIVTMMITRIARRALGKETGDVADA